MKRQFLIPLTAIILAVILVAGWYLVSPLFIDSQVNEENIQSGTITMQGTFTGADSFHQVSGDALILEENGKRYLRLENFESTNGPDLKVYLATDTQASDYTSLGELKGNIGNQNYEIPDEVNLDQNDQVLIWCEAFSVLFGHAEIK